MPKISKVIYVSTILLCYAIIFITGCSSTHIVKVAPPFKFIESSFSLDVDINDTEVVPIGKSSSFSPGNTQIVSLIKIINVSGKHKIRWDWYRPDGKLYISSKNQTLKVGSGKYHEKMNAGHKILVKGESSSQYPGSWLVNIYFDNDIIYSSHFEIKTD